MPWHGACTRCTVSCTASIRVNASLCIVACVCPCTRCTVSCTASICVNTSLCIVACVCPDSRVVRLDPPVLPTGPHHHAPTGREQHPLHGPAAYGSCMLNKGLSRAACKQSQLLLRSIASICVGCAASCSCTVLPVVPRRRLCCALQQYVGFIPSFSFSRADDFTWGNRGACASLVLVVSSVVTVVWWSCIHAGTSLLL